MKKMLLIPLLLMIGGGGFFLLFPDKAATVMDFVKLQTTSKYSVAQRLEQFGTEATSRLAPHFQHAGVVFPPTAITLLAFKDSKRLELYDKCASRAFARVDGWALPKSASETGALSARGERPCLSDYLSNPFYAECKRGSTPEKSDKS